MAGTTPSFDSIRGLIESHKPPLTCRVVEVAGGAVRRAATVIFDGINGWYIDDGSRIELRAAEDRATFVENGTVERVGPGMVVSSGSWVKTAIDGRRMAYLDRATGTGVGQETIDGRRCLVADVEGLKRNDDAVFRLHVDAETGVIIRMARADTGEILRVEDLVVGIVELPR